MNYRLGDFVELLNEQCGNPNLTVWDISGVNADKEFFEPSKQAGGDTSGYRNVPPKYFACNLMHVGRDRLLPVALNHTNKTKVVSPAYTVFRIKDNVPLMREYFFMMLKSAERDRYFWFHTDSSVRDGMSWGDFCDLEITVPPVNIQQKYVNIYNSMLANQQAYKNGLDDMKFVCEAFIDQLKYSERRVAIGDLLEEIDNRNTDGKIKSVQGINITKQFMPSIASSNDLLKYKVVKKGQFAYSSMQTGRDKCIRIALFQGDTPIVVSPAYSVLQRKTDDVLEEYIQMWFLRGESDRIGWFMSDSSVRANLDLPRFFEIEIPLPNLETQQSLVKIYNSYITRRVINEKLKAQIKNICPILIKGSLEEAMEAGMKNE